MSCTHTFISQVLTFIFVTLAYFQLLQAVKESDFLNAVGSGPLSSSQQVHSQVLAVNSLARAASGDWKPIEPTETAPAGSQHLFIKQIAISHDSPRRASNQLNSVVAFDRHLRQAPTAEHTSFEDDLCFKTPKGQCFAASALSDAHQADTTTLLYALKHNELAWPPADALPWTDEAAEVTFSSTRHRNRTPLHIQSASSDKRSATSPAASASSGILRDAGLGISLPLSPKQGSTLASDELASWEYHASRSSIREMAGLKWAFYAVRSFMLRFWSLAKVCTHLTVCHLALK